MTIYRCTDGRETAPASQLRDSFSLLIIWRWIHLELRGRLVAVQRSFLLKRYRPRPVKLKTKNGLKTKLRHCNALFGLLGY